jgi:O-antigen ligase
MTSIVSVPSGSTAWWRPEQPRTTAVGVHAPAAVDAPAASRLAFGSLVAFTCILLLSPQIWLPILGTLRIAFLAAGCAIVGLLSHRMARQQRVTPFFPEVGIAIALVSWSVITLPVSYWPTGSLTVLTDHYLKAVVFFWLIGALVATTERLRLFAWTLVLCSVPLAATGVRNYFTGVTLSTGVTGFERISGYAGGSGIAGNPNDLALLLNLIIPVAGALVLSARTASGRLLAAGALSLAAVAVILTFSRAGFLTLATTFVLFLLTLARGRAIGKAAVLLLAALLVIGLLPRGYADRLRTIANVSADRTGSAEGRWRDYRTALGVVASHPIIGVGIGQDVLAMNASRGDDWISVHNVFLQYAVDLGIPGVLLFLWLYLSCFRSARAVERRAAREPAVRGLANLAAGVRIALVSFGVAAFFHPIAYQFYFFSIAGLAVALKHAYLTESAQLPVMQSRTS